MVILQFHHSPPCNVILHIKLDTGKIYNASMSQANFSSDDKNQLGGSLVDDLVDYIKLIDYIVTN